MSHLLNGSAIGGYILLDLGHRHLASGRHEMGSSRPDSLKSSKIHVGVFVTVIKQNFIY